MRGTMIMRMLFDNVLMSLNFNVSVYLYNRQIFTNGSGGAAIISSVEHQY